MAVVIRLLFNPPDALWLWHERKTFIIVVYFKMALCTCMHSHLCALTYTYLHPHTLAFLHFHTRTHLHSRTLTLTNTHQARSHTLSNTPSHTVTVARTYTYTLAHLNGHSRAHSYTHTHWHAYTHWLTISAHLSARASVHACTLARMHTIHTRTHAHTFICTCEFLTLHFIFSYVFAKRRRLPYFAY